MALKAINKHHFGIYGIVLKDDFILLVRKSRGPYTGKLDLPGGRPEHGETPAQTLAREVLEETGVVVQTARAFENYGTVAQQVNQDNIEENIHHLGMVYFVESYDDAGLITEMDAEDSLGAQWYRLTTLTKDMLSPFTFEAVAAIKK